MHDLPIFKRLYYRYLSNAYAFTYHTSLRTVVGITIGGWIKLLAVALLACAFILRWGELMVGVTAVLLIWVYFSYWRAKRAGYSHFVADDGPLSFPDKAQPNLPPNQKVKTWATGVFSVSDQDDFMLLRPAEYWQVPLGEHIIMVQQRKTKKYRYQFFNASTLQQVQKGWLLFGARPRETLAVTLLSEFGPDFESQQVSQFMSGREHNKKKGVPRTVYLSFASNAERELVWDNIIRAG